MTLGTSMFWGIGCHGTDVCSIRVEPAIFSIDTTSKQIGWVFPGRSPRDGLDELSLYSIYGAVKHWLIPSICADI
jgi:hypothetical protein